MPNITGIAVGIRTWRDQAGQIVQRFHLLARENDIPTRYEVTATRSRPVGHGHVVKVLHAGAEPAPPAPAGYTQPQWAVETEGSGLKVLRARNVLKPRTT